MTPQYHKPALTELDTHIIERVDTAPGLPVADVVRAFLAKPYSDAHIRQRCMFLDAAGAIRLEKRNGRLYAYPRPGRR